jgi:hypothetical protein
MAQGGTKITVVVLEQLFGCDGGRRCGPTQEIGDDAGQEVGGGVAPVESGKEARVMRGDDQAECLAARPAQPPPGDVAELVGAVH